MSIEENTQSFGDTHLIGERLGRGTEVTDSEFCAFAEGDLSQYSAEHAEFLTTVLSRSPWKEEVEKYRAPTHHISRSLGRANELSDEEFYLYVLEVHDGFSNEDLQRIESIVSQEPWKSRALILQADRNEVQRLQGLGKL